MPSDQNARFTPDRRLHRLSWLFVLASTAKAVVGIFIGIAIFGSRNPAVFWGLLVLVPIGAQAVLHQWVFRYGFGPRGLVIKKGLLFRNRREIAYHRIENLNTERNILHRLVGVAQVTVETSTGGSQAEGTFQVLGLEAVEEMRRRVFASRQAAPAAAPNTPDERTLLHLEPGELVRFGLTDNRSLVVLLALAGALTQMGAMRFASTHLSGVLGAFNLAGVMDNALLFQVLWVIGAVVIAFVGAAVLSILLALITLYDFRLTRDAPGDTQGYRDLRTHYGLFTRVATTLRQRRIQAVHRRASWRHRLLGRVSVQVEIAGGTRQPDAQQQSGSAGGQRDLWVAPVCRPDQARALIAAALPGFRGAVLDRADWQPLAPGAFGRLMRLGLIVWLLAVSVPALWFLNGWGVWVMAAGVGPAWLFARLYVRYTAWAIEDGFLLYRHGWLTRRLSVVRLDRVQTVRVGRSPLDRWHGMAGVFADTAGAAPWGQRVNIHYLDTTVARRLAARLYTNRAGERAAGAFSDDSA